MRTSPSQSHDRAEPGLARGTVREAGRRRLPAGAGP